MRCFRVHIPGKGYDLVQGSLLQTSAIPGEGLSSETPSASTPGDWRVKSSSQKEVFGWHTPVSTPDSSLFRGRYSKKWSLSSSGNCCVWVLCLEWHDLHRPHEESCWGQSWGCQRQRKPEPCNSVELPQQHCWSWKPSCLNQFELVFSFLKRLALWLLYPVSKLNLQKVQVIDGGNGRENRQDWLNFFFDYGLALWKKKRL